MLSKRRNINKKEFIIEKFLQGFTLLTVLTTVAIIVILSKESFIFFRDIGIVRFFTEKSWTPLLEPKHFGVMPLLNGTLIIAVIAIIIAIPIGLGVAIYLSEYAPKKIKKILKPMVEILAGIPSIVYGYFALTFITPLLQKIFPNIEIFNALSAGIAVGIMIIPMISSLSEDAMSSISSSVRDGAYGLGATKLEVVTKIVIPGAISGIISSFILAISRAIGETMIVAIAAGSRPSLTLNPLKSIQTITGYMVSVAKGDVQRGTVEYQSIFAVGTVLFLLTFVLNIIAKKVVKKGKEFHNA